MVSMDHALRHCGLPCLMLWYAILPRKPGLVAHQDKQDMVKVVQSGCNLTMHYLGRAHGVSVAWLHETFKGADLTLAYEVSARVAADIYTKAFADPEKWKSACVLVGICDPKEHDDLASRSTAWEQPLPQSGGTTPHSPNSRGGPFRNCCGRP